MTRGLLLWASQNPWLSKKLPKRRFVQRAVTRFMPGETLDHALRETRRLGDRGIGTILTLLGENLVDISEAEKVREHYLEAFDRIRDGGFDAEVSVKLTQLGLDLDRAAAEEHLYALARKAAENGGFLWVDMESSAYVDTTLELYRNARSRQSCVGLALQSYLRRTPADLEDLLPLAPTIRLVKGAYAEPPEIAFPKKSDVDEQYFSLSRKMLEATRSIPGTRVAFGTHDTTLIHRIRSVAEDLGAPKNAYEFDMLFGIGREEQARLVQEGERTVALISYGESWFPWYMRRLAERPANLWFVLRSMVSR